MSIVVFIALFNHGEGEDEDEWRQKGKEKSHFKVRDELRKSCDEVEKVEKIFELLVQDNRNKCYY